MYISNQNKWDVNSIAVTLLGLHHYSIFPPETKQQQQQQQYSKIKRTCHNIGVLT